MLTASYAFFALAQVALAIWAFALYARRPSLGAFTVALPIALLVWDNGVVAIGALLGDGEVLRWLSYPRFVGHALLTPIWIITAFEYARRLGIARLQGRASQLAEWGIYGLMVAYGAVRSLVLLDMQPVRQGELLYYTNKGGFPGPPLPAIVMVLVLGWAGYLVFRETRWPWMLAGAVVMFVAALAPTDVFGFWPSNTGEVVLALALVLTEWRLQALELSSANASEAGIEPASLNA